jgi:hypothetical protein
MRPMRKLAPLTESQQATLQFELEWSRSTVPAKWGARVYAQAAREGVIEARMEYAAQQRVLRQAAHQERNRVNQEAARVARELRIAAHQGRGGPSWAAKTNGSRRVRKLQSRYDTAMEEIERPTSYWG